MVITAEPKSHCNGQVHTEPKNEMGGVCHSFLTATAKRRRSKAPQGKKCTSKSVKIMKIREANAALLSNPEWELHLKESMFKYLQGRQLPQPLDTRILKDKSRSKWEGWGSGGGSHE